MHWCSSIILVKITPWEGIYYIFTMCSYPILIFIAFYCFFLVSQSLLCPFYPFSVKTSLISLESCEWTMYQEYFKWGPKENTIRDTAVRVSWKVGNFHIWMCPFYPFFTLGPQFSARSIGLIGTTSLWTMITPK